MKGTQRKGESVLLSLRMFTVRDLTYLVCFSVFCCQL